jgi:DNA-directed RNA polymerase specialized sigma24 family protein
MAVPEAAEVTDLLKAWSDGDQASLTSLLVLDEALEAFSQVAPRQAKVLGLRYFGSLNVQETAAVLQIADCGP